MATSPRLMGEGLTLSYLAMLEGPGVHFDNKQDCAPLKSHYVPCQKKRGIPRQDLTAQSKAANVFSVLSLFRGSITCEVK